MAEKREGTNLAGAMTYMATESFVLNKVQSVRNEIPAASNALPKEAGTAAAGDATEFSRGDHVHPAETEVVEYRLPDDCFPVTYADSEFPSGQQSRTVTSNEGIRFEFESINNNVILHDIASEAAGGYEYGFSTFSASTLKWGSKDAPIENLKFNNTAPTANTWPVLEKDAVFVREVRMAKASDISVTSVNSKTGAVLLSASDVGALPTTGGEMTGGLTIPNLTVGSRQDGSTVGTNSVAEGFRVTASGLESHAEGFLNVASGNNSHAEGRNTVAQNEAEHAQGMFNVSHKASGSVGNAGNTLSSIGCGSIVEPRNAVETMQDGKTFILGIGGYNGKNPTSTGVQDLATAFNNKAPLASPAFTGTPTAPTPAAGDDSTKVATTAFVKSATLGNTGYQNLNGTLEIMGGGSSVPTLIEAGRIVMDSDSVGRATIDIPYRPTTAETFAFLSDIAVKSVKLNGSPLTPDANGAVDVPALPLTGGTITGDLTITTALWLHYLNSSAFGGDLFRFKRFDDATDEPYDVMRREDLAGLAPLASPAFTGTPTAPTPTAGDDSTKVATTAFVKTETLGNSGNQTLNGLLQVYLNEYHTGAGVLLIGNETYGLGLNLSQIIFYVNGVKYIIAVPQASGTLALLADMYAAVQQIAPDFTAKAYAQYELCSYNGVVYRCKSAYTATAQSAKPSSDATHWEAKKVSELFLPLQGGDQIAGTINLPTDSGKYLQIDGYYIRPNGGPDGNSFELDASFASEYSVVRKVNLSSYAPLVSPAFTGTPTAPTPTAGDNSTKVATTAFVKAETLGNSSNQTLDGNLQVGTNAQENIHLLADTATVVAERVQNNHSQYSHSIPNGTKDDTLALLSQIYAAVQQIAPDFTAKAYAANDLCTYNGVVYRCILGYTATSSSAKPNNDTTHWEAKKVSELFLPLTGGTIVLPYSDDRKYSFAIKDERNGTAFEVLSQDEEDAYIINLGQVDVMCSGGTDVYVDSDNLHLTDKGNLLSQVLALLAPLASPAFTGTPTAPTPAAGDDSTKVATTAFVQDAKRYTIGAVQTISTASQDSSGGTTINYGEATLLDRTVNQIEVTVAIDQLRITLPAATPGKVRDFAVRLEVGTGSAALAAPAIVVVSPDGETIVCENSTGVWPVAENGTATAKGVTMLYFSETSASHFLFQARKLVAIS